MTQTASMAHEILRPLAAIGISAEAALQWLNRAEPDLDEVRALVRNMVTDSRRAATMVAGARGTVAWGAAGPG